MAFEFSGDELVLEARSARLKGKLKIEDGTHIGYWMDPDDTAAWTEVAPGSGARGLLKS